MLYANGKPVGGGGAGGNTNSVELTYAEYLALSDAEKMNGTEYFITDINGDGSQFQPIIYSLEEREIGVWTDGKPLYEKTWDLGSDIAITTWTSVMTLTGIDNLVKSESVQNDTSVSFIEYWIDGTTLKGKTLRDNDAVDYVRYLTLQYTKTTDVAGSGTWTPQGVPAVHYSTDEQIIGTYFGDTLYQKTIVLASDVAIVDSWTTIYTDALIGNISQLVDVKYNNVSNKGVYGVLNFKPNGNNLQAIYPISGGLNVLAGAKFTLQYTKTS